MYFQIREIVLWPRHGDHAPRRLRFHLGVVNVVTGASKTGKSAIIPIIDYCLGADKCTVPSGTIREACEWFGVVVQTSEGQLLLARREPGSNKSTSDMYLMEAHEVVVPHRIEERRLSVDSVKARLNEMAGLTQLDFDFEQSGSGFKGRPSFRDMVAFTFQPQNIVANPDVLFYKADTYEHREKLRTIFPYVLGAVSARILSLQHEQQRLRIELRRKERELDAVSQISLRWVAEIQAKVSRARELGLVQGPVGTVFSTEAMLAQLREVVGSTVVETQVTAGTIMEAGRELTEITREETSVSAHLAHLKRRHAEMERLRSTSNEYHDALIVKRDRLRIADWLRDLQVQHRECPMCGTETLMSREVVEELYQALRQTESQVGSLENLPASFDREHQRVTEEVALATEQLRALGIRRRSLENHSEAAQHRQYSLSAAARFVGAVEESIAQYDQIGSDGELTMEVEALRERLSAIDDDLRKLDIAGAKSRALLRVSSHASKILPQLDIERPHDPARLSIDDLSVVVTGQDREDYLWEIGSGANWLGYHIAITLALHQLFLERGLSPVPGFAIYDQPSQVYFPGRLSDRVRSAEEEEQEEEDLPYHDEDVEAVAKIFKVLGQACIEWDGRWQVIVLDHAPPEIWRDLPGVRMVEEWRRGEKLVPPNWLK